MRSPHPPLELSPVGHAKRLLFRGDNGFLGYDKRKKIRKRFGGGDCVVYEGDCGIIWG